MCSTTKKKSQTSSKNQGHIEEATISRVVEEDGTSAEETMGEAVASSAARPAATTPVVFFEPISTASIPAQLFSNALQQKSFQEKVKDEAVAKVQTVNPILPALKHIFPIMGGSSLEPESNKQKKQYQRRVHHIRVQGPYIKIKWSHVPIMFDQSDLRLRDYPHNDAMVINCNIGGYVIHDVLVDNGGPADILKAKAFRQMNLGDVALESAMNPLCGFRGRRVEALGKIALQVSFGDINNPRTELVTFDVVDVNYPYNAILGRGTLNTFEAALHSAYLIMRIPAYKGVISVYGSQEDA
ncbi:hypothetical protein BS78_09G095700 [Paspalum vaginatum]|nr:hypothetical protein BS78_09G095700 [Paspalum vaginatum]